MAVAPAVHRTVLVVDVSAFGDQRRTNLHQLAVRRGLYDVLERVFNEAGLSWPDCDREDRGDGVLVIIPVSVPKGVLVEELPGRLAAALRAHNTGRPAEERIRLRMSLHAGEIHYDEHGVSGRAVNLAFRLLDAPEFRQAHDRSTALLAVVTSAWFYEEVIWHSATAERDAYRRIQAVVKETAATAWVRLVGGEPVAGPEPPVPTGGPVPHQLPSSTRQFVGRQGELARLTRLLDDAGSLVLVAIDGMAGIGKTALALTWTHQVCDRFPDGQLHVNLRGFDQHEPVDPDQALHGFLQALGVSARAIPAELDAKAALYRSLLAERRMLVVLDNARSSEHVRPLLPGSPTCVVVVTSRNRLDSLLVREGAHRVALDVLSHTDAFALLAERVDRNRLTAEARATGELIDLCARLPLALSVAAARAASQPVLPVGGLVRALRDERYRLDELDLGDADLSPRAVFSWSYAVLSAEAARLFRLLGIHPGADIGAHACRALTGDHASGAMRELTGAHLLTEYLPGRFRCHDLLRAYAVELAAIDPERRAAGDRLVEYYLRAAMLADRRIQPHRYGRDDLDPVTDLDLDDYDDAIAWFTAEHATLRALVDFASEQGWTERAWRLAWACTTFLRRTGRWTERVAIHQTALAAVVAAGDKLGEAVVSRHLATAVARLGQFSEAMALLGRAAVIYRDLGDMGGAFKNHLAYARVFDADGNHFDALEHAQAAWSLIRGVDDRLGHADALSAMGRQLCLLDRHDQALPLCTLALDLYTAIGHPEGRADALLSLGDIERTLGRHANAVEHYRRSLELDRQLGDRYWEAVSLERLADAYKDTGDPSATPTLREALDAYREIGHPAAGRVQERLADDLT